MGLLKFLARLFKCNSNCSFNLDYFNTDELCKVDLGKYQLKVSDLLRIEKIIKKRPSINTYYKPQITQITQL